MKKLFKMSGCLSRHLHRQECLCSELACEFMEALENSASKRELLRTYKTFLGNALLQRYSRLITPSTFLINGEGQRPDKGGTPESWAEERFCGLAVEKQFVPLPNSLRQQRKPLAKEFEKYYCEYKKETVTPLVKWIRDADQMFYLLDTTQLLMGGPSMYNDEQGIVEHILEICDNDGKFWARFGRT